MPGGFIPRALRRPVAHVHLGARVGPAHQRIVEHQPRVGDARRELQPHLVLPRGGIGIEPLPAPRQFGRALRGPQRGEFLARLAEQRRHVLEAPAQRGGQPVDRPAEQAVGALELAAPVRENTRPRVPARPPAGAGRRPARPAPSRARARRAASERHQPHARLVGVRAPVDRGFEAPPPRCRAPPRRAIAATRAATPCRGACSPRRPPAPARSRARNIRAPRRRSRPARSRARARARRAGARIAPQHLVEQPHRALARFQRAFIERLAGPAHQQRGARGGVGAARAPERAAREGAAPRSAARAPGARRGSSGACVDLVRDHPGRGCGATGAA